MIYTVTLNPSLDRTLSIPRLQTGALHRARAVGRDLGGKGINVSRALRSLGIESTVIGFTGGPAGEALRGGLMAAGFRCEFIAVDGETRQNITLLEEETGACTKINEPGPQVGPEGLAALGALIAAEAKRGDLWAFCGSLPPGAPPDLYARLIVQVQERGGLAFLDTSGAPLRAGVAARPFAVKPNADEAGELLGRSVETDAECEDAATALANTGLQLVCLTRGARGLLLAYGGQLVAAVPPRIVQRSPIGAGDASLAGLLWGVVDGCGPVELARRAAACGAGAAMQEGTGVGSRELVEELLEQVQATVLQCA
ncbi:MAG: 1-phosphofructokinase family hexose kinase [Anaerolineae bacterium]|nr:1-phosphofructokinase family hexose kinase [Anaerolineae bacterium]